MAGNVTVVLAEGRRVMRLARELTSEVFDALLDEYQRLLRKWLGPLVRRDSNELQSLRSYRGGDR